MGRACRPQSHARTCFIAQLDINPESVSGFRLLMPPSRGSGLFAPGAMSALQKYNVKKIDLFSVTVTNSFLGERVGNKKTPTPTSAKKYENSPSNQQESCVYTYPNAGCGPLCRGRGSISVPGGVTTRYCSAECSPAASNSTLLHSGGFRRIACSPQFASGCQTVDLPTRHIDRSARARTGRSKGPPGQAAQCRWSITAVQPRVQSDADDTRSVANL
jgi:hypothetical protein